MYTNFISRAGPTYLTWNTNDECALQYYSKKIGTIIACYYNYCIAFASNVLTEFVNILYKFDCKKSIIASLPLAWCCLPLAWLALLVLVFGRGSVAVKFKILYLSW